MWWCTHSCKIGSRGAWLSNETPESPTLHVRRGCSGSGTSGEAPSSGFKCHWRQEWKSGLKVCTQDTFASCPSSLPATLSDGKVCKRFSDCPGEWLPWSWDPLQPKTGREEGVCGRPDSQLYTQETASRTDLVIVAHPGPCSLEWDLSGETEERQGGSEVRNQSCSAAQSHSSLVNTNRLEGPWTQEKHLHTWRLNLAAKGTENPGCSHIELSMIGKSNPQIGKFQYKTGQDDTRGLEYKNLQNTKRQKTQQSGQEVI